MRLRHREGHVGRAWLCSTGLSGVLLNRFLFAHLLGLGLMLIFVVLFLPGGLVGLIQRARITSLLDVWHLQPAAREDET
ncbi:MAG: hypothetical protein Q9O62_02990 [Ardenticatenia bacterium]|nr:hypothetical protein [Ardenticatenia bacterium]